MCIPYAPDGWLNLAWVTTIHDVWSTEAAQAQLLLWVAGEGEPYRFQGEEREALLAWLQAQDATRRSDGASSLLRGVLVTCGARIRHGASYPSLCRIGEDAPGL